MFRDAREELERLEAELLAAEHADQRDLEDALLDEFLAEDDDDLLADFFDEPEQDDAGRSAVYYNYSNQYGRKMPNNAAYNSDPADTDMNAYSDAVRHGKPESLRGLLVTVMLLLTGILGILVYWLIRFV